MLSVAQDLAVLGKVGKHRPADVVADVDAARMNASAVPKDDRAFVTDEFKWLDLGHDVAHEIVVRR